MDTDHRAEAAQASVAAETAVHPHVILVVDDDRAILHLLQELLEDAGYSVLLASNGRHALELAQHTPIALVLTDYMMPRLNGLELREHLFANPATHTIPVILLSAAPPDGVTSLFAAVILKPFQISELLMIVQRYQQPEEL